VRKHIDLTKTILGEELFESLNKALNKLSTKSVIDIGELHDSLKIAPKAIIAFLIKELKDLPVNGAKEIKLPWADNVHMLVNKKDKDVYAGHIRDGGKIVHEFALTAIPQLAVHILSLLEMYPDDLGSATENETPKEEVKEPVKEASNTEDRLDNLEQKLNETQMQMLNDKVDDLMRVVANQESPKAELAIKTEDLTKKGLMPSMPAPPAAGSAGGVKAPKTGIMGDKTPATDANLKTPKMKMPNLKSPKAMQQGIKNPFLKSLKMSLNKSQNGTCADCGESEIQNGIPVQCACFRALSKPVIKTEGTVLSLSFKEDWDSDSVQMLYKSLMSRSNGKR